MDDAFEPDPGLSWSQLRAFQACLRLGSFGAAAEALGQTSAAVRHQVGLLEQRLGGPLFDREAGRLAPTPMGLGFGREIEAPLHALMTACANATAAAGDAPITLAAPPLFARRFLMSNVFLRWCHDNRVHLDVTDMRRRVAPSVAVVRLGATEDDAVRTRLVKVTLALAGAPEAAPGARPREAAWWRQQTLLSPSADEGAWGLLWTELGLTPVAPRQALQFSSYATAIDAARDGGGVVLAPLPLAEADIRSGRLVVLDPARVALNAGYDLLMAPSLASTPRGRALRRRLLAARRD
jgi:LysR family glycine cleavage system transcriptional activator